jgi:SAM-dependent methyltransferase
MNSEQFQVHAQVEDRHWWFDGRRRILLDVVAALLGGSGSESLVVDVGCGTGANAAALNRCFRCVGIDLSEEAIRSARQRFPDVHFILGTVPDALGRYAAEADLFVLADVLEHIEDDRQFLASLVAVAKPDARFLITVPADPGLWTEHDVSFGHYRRYVPSTLRGVWADLPVEEVALAGLNTRLYDVIKAVRWLNRRLGRTSGRAGTDFEMPPGPVNAILTRLFSGESGRLVRELTARRHGREKRGVSLLAVLRRQQGGEGSETAAGPARTVLPAHD